MASFRQRCGGWQARVTRRGFPPEVGTFRTKAEAEAWARSIESDMDRGMHQCTTVAERTTLAEILLRYGDEVSPSKKGGADECIRLAALARSRIGRFSLANVSAPALAKHRDERLQVVSGATVIRDLALLSSVLNHARREWNLPIGNPVRDVRMPKQQRGRDRVLSSDEESRLLDALTPIRRRSPWVRPIVIVALETAMRRGELLGLRWSDVNLERRTAVLHDTKNGERRVVPLSTRAVETLRNLPRSIDGRVFPISHFFLHNAFRNGCRRAGVDGFHFHDLRHTATTRLAERLPNLAELSAVTGHKSLQMLKRYYHPSAERLAEKLA